MYKSMGFFHKIKKECLSLHKLPNTFLFPTISPFDSQWPESYITLCSSATAPILGQSGRRQKERVKKQEGSVKLGRNIPLPQLWLLPGSCCDLYCCHHRKAGAQENGERGKKKNMENFTLCLWMLEFS